MKDAKLIVFSGPPCSGKSHLASKVSERLGFPHLEMDMIRVRLMPDSKHDRDDRQIAYRAMHVVADWLLASGVSVILDATYGPSEQRREVETIAVRRGVPVFLIECRTPVRVAVSRFVSQRHEHPAADLTPSRVEALAGSYPYFGRGLTVDTTRDLSACLDDVVEYIECGTPIPVEGEWSGDRAGTWEQAGQLTGTR
jgi:predicted kinase